MCGRASLSKDIQQLEKRFNAAFDSAALEQQAILPNFNIAPTQLHPVITSDDPTQFHFFKWGFIPSWAKEASIGSRMINARIETVIEKPAFKKAIHKQRCLVPFDGFYEWKKTSNGKQPYFIRLKSKDVFSTAGIWEKWQNKEDEIIHSFSVLTQTPNNMMSAIHNRMPAILLPQQEALWLDHSIPTTEVLKMIAPYPDELMEAYTVSKKVNNVRNNDATLIDFVKYDEPTQGSLF